MGILQYQGFKLNWGGMGGWGETSPACNTLFPAPSWHFDFGSCLSGSSLQLASHPDGSAVEQVTSGHGRAGAGCWDASCRLPVGSYLSFGFSKKAVSPEEPESPLPALCRNSDFNELHPSRLSPARLASLAASIAKAESVARGSQCKNNLKCYLNSLG